MNAELISQLVNEAMELDNEEIEILIERLEELKED